MATFDLGRVTPLYKGDYSASTSYELNDVVLYNGNLYWHIQATATVGILPTDTTVWKLAFSDEGVRAEIRGYADNAQASADSALASKSAAATSASNASASASQAALSAQSASTSEGNASASASAAATSATNSAVSAQSAASSAQTATDKATLASQKAAAASESATLATAKASAAATSETNAAASAQTATTKASEAAASATSAQEYDESAQQSAVNAQTAQGLAETAQTGAETAQGLAEDARDEAQEIVDEIGAKASQIDANTESIASLENDCYKPYAVDTASGAVVSFMDGADDIPLKSLVVNIDPVQDLHGYDSPWPAGGGKNLLENTSTSQTINGITFTVNSDGSVTANGTANGTSSLVVGTVELVANTQYILSGCPSDGSGTTYNVRIRDSSYVTLGFDLGTEVIITPSETKTYYYQITVASGTTVSNLLFKPMIRLASIADDTYAPYSNICPISGWEGMTINAAGKNLLNANADTTSSNGVTYTKNGDGTYTVNGTATSASSFIVGSVELTAGTQYVLSGCPTNGSGSTYNVRVRDASYNALGYDIGSGKTITPAETKTFYYQITVASGTSVSNLVFKPMICLSTAPNPDYAHFAPYNGQAIPIDWQTEAGTVYGGHLDVLSGVLTVYPYYASYNGETLTGRWISDRDVYAVGTNPTIGAQVVNIGTEGTEIQLSPTEVKSLLGQNNIFADTGDSVVEYRADTKLYIERLTEPDADMIADANIISGQYFMVGNSLYLATANIASGSAVIVGTNCTQKSLSEALNEINQ